MSAYSRDVRQRVVSAGEAGGGTSAEVAARFQVGPTLVKKMPRQWREGGDLPPRPHGGGATASWGTSHRQKLAQQGKKAPAAPLEEVRQLLGETAQGTVSEAPGCRALPRFPVARKTSAEPIGHAIRTNAPGMGGASRAGRGSACNALRQRPCIRRGRAGMGARPPGSGSRRVALGTLAAPRP